MTNEEAAGFQKMFLFLSLKKGCRAPKNVGTCEHNSREPPFHQKLYYLKYRKGGGGLNKLRFNTKKVIDFTVF